MPNITLAVPEEIYEVMKKYTESAGVKLQASLREIHSQTQDIGENGIRGEIETF